MADQLSKREADALVAQAVNAKAASMVLKLLADAGLDAPAIAGALLTGATAVIQNAYDPPHRLRVLNAMLAETIHEWADAAAIDPASAGRA